MCLSIYQENANSVSSNNRNGTSIKQQPTAIAQIKLATIVEVAPTAITGTQRDRSSNNVSSNKISYNICKIIKTNFS